VLILDVLHAMYRRKREGTRFDSEPTEQLRPLRASALLEQLVHHGVAGYVNTLRGDPFPQQDLPRPLRGREKVVGQVVGEDPIDLFGHAAIIGPQARLNMSHEDSHLLRRQPRRQHRVRVPLHHQHIGPLKLENRFQSGDDRADLVCLGAGAHVQVVVRSGQIQLSKEHAVQFVGVVLAGVAEDVRNTTCLAGTDHWGHLDDLWAGAHDYRDLHRRRSSLIPELD
jgi:hypothetical protein